jgi:predicted CopG family antitoxin
MSKTVKLENAVYFRLDQLREKRETFSECVARLIALEDQVRKITDSLGTTLYPGDRTQNKKEF